MHSQQRFIIYHYFYYYYCKKKNYFHFIIGIYINTNAIFLLFWMRKTSNWDWYKHNASGDPGIKQWKGVSLSNDGSKFFFFFFLSFARFKYWFVYSFLFYLIQGTKIIAVAYNDYIYTYNEATFSWKTKAMDLGRLNWNAVFCSSDASYIVAAVQNGILFTYLYHQ